MKKALSIILVLALACSLFAGAALAAANDYVLSGGSVTVDGTADQTVDVVFTSVKGGTFYSFEADWSMKETESSSYLKLSALTSDKASAAMENSADTGRTVWTDMSFSNGLTVAANGAIWTATYTVDKNTPSGTYTVSLNVKGFTGSDFNPDTDAQGLRTATITVTNNSAPAAGYTVTAAADKTDVAVGDTVNITLDVTNSDKTTFSAFEGTLTYNATVFTYSASGSTLGGFDVTDNSGTLTITRYGSNVTIPGSGAELTLAFTAAAAGTGTFTLSDVKVSEADNADTDAAAATVPATPSVTVSQTYTVTFVGGDGATGTAPTQDPVTAGTSITLPAATAFTKDGFTFAGWYCSVDKVTYNAGASYTMTAADTTFTAQWTEDTPTATATASIVSDYLEGYTLIKVTTANTNQTPTYNGAVMFKPEGTAYDSDAYYYIVSGDVTAEIAQGNLGWSDTAATTLTKDGDANQTGLIDINDAQFIYNLYNGVTVSYVPTAAQLLASDVNGDGKVDTLDCAASIAAIQ